jgi:hypothetical protein
LLVAARRLSGDLSGDLDLNDRPPVAAALACPACDGAQLPCPHHGAVGSATVGGSLDLMQPTISRETILIDRRQPSLRWSAVLAGAVCSVGFWMLLQLLGLGIGLAATDVRDAESLSGVGVGTTLWSLISPLIAMFFGGILAGRLSQTSDRKLAGTHALVMWAITSIAGLSATIWIVTMVAGGAVRAGSVALDATGGVISSATGRVDPGDALRTLGVEPNDLMAPINQRLTAQGKPEITAAQLEAAMRDVVQRGLRSGFDRELLIEQLAANTKLSRADAADVARQIEAQVATLTSGARDLQRRAETYALGAVDVAGKALATVGLSLLLSLVTSIAGAVLAVRRSQRPGGGSRGRDTRTTDPGYTTPPVEPTHPSAQYPGPAVPPTNITSP